MRREDEQHSAQILPGLGVVAVRAFGWQFGSVVIVAVTQVTVLAVLSRLLEPEVFGVVAICNLLISLLRLFYELGVAPALVHARAVEERQIGAAIAFTVTTAACLYSILWFAAPAIAHSFEAQHIVYVLRWLSVSILLAGPGAVGRALMERDLKFRDVSLIDSARSVVYAVTVVTLALQGLGVWAIVIGSLASTAGHSGALLASTRSRLAFSLDWGCLGPLLAYGGGLTLSRIFNFLAQNADFFVIGNTLGVSILGVYERSFQLMKAPAALLGRALDQSLFPIMSRLQDEPERLKRGFFRGLAAGYLVQLPFSAVVVVLAPEIVRVLLGPDWGDAVVPLQVLAISLPLRILCRLSDVLVRAKGATYRSALRKAIFAAMVFGLSTFGSRWGIEGVAVAVLFAVISNYILMAHLAHHLIGATWRQHLAAMRLGTGVGLVVLVLAHIVASLTRWVGSFGPMSRLAVCIVGIGAGLFLMSMVSPRLRAGLSTVLEPVRRARRDRPRAGPENADSCTSSKDWSNPS